MKAQLQAPWSQSAKPGPGRSLWLSDWDSECPHVQTGLKIPRPPPPPATIPREEGRAWETAPSSASRPPPPPLGSRALGRAVAVAYGVRSFTGSELASPS